MATIPNETDIEHAIREHLAHEFDVASSLLDFGIDLPTVRPLDTIKIPFDTVVTALALYCKATLFFRSTIRLCEVGLDRPARPLTRSLFENWLNLAFVLRRKVSLYTFNQTGKQPLDLFNEKLTTEFRTALFGAWCWLRDEHNVKQQSRTPGLKRQAKGVKHKLDTLEKPYADIIGTKWMKRIRGANTCAGLTVTDFAASLGPEFRRWHRAVYPSESQTVHQSDAMEYVIMADDDDPEVNIRWHTSLPEVAQALHKGAVCYLGCTEELNKRLKAGDAVKQQIHGFGTELRSWKHLPK